jgi:hypothetical protein
MELGITLKSTLLNPNPGDLALTETGEELVLTRLDLEVAQRLFIRLQFFKSEWFLDENEGAPFFERILVKNPGDRVIRSVFAQIIEGTEGVAQLAYFNYNISSERKMSVIFKAKLVDGSTFTSTNYGQFVVADV